jgi:poly(A) polymerase
VSKELLKLLAAADPGPSIAAMAATGVLETLLPGALPARLEALLDLERAAGLEPEAELRLAALLPPDAQAVGATAKRLRLPNALANRLAGAAGDWSEARTSQGARRAVYGLGAQAAADRLRLAWSADAADPAWPGAWTEVQAWRPPMFPVTGEDIKALGVAQGPEVGRVRRAVETWWIAADFPDDREAALAALRTAVTELASR